jgi:putative cardiolipin synthase
LFHDDLVGTLFLHALLKTADRGVRVRLLLDDMTLDDDKDIGVAAFDAHPQVQVRVFNPFVRKSARWTQILTRFDDVTRRMHNKPFSVDNQFTVVGGRWKKTIVAMKFWYGSARSTVQISVLPVSPTPESGDASESNFYNCYRSSGYSSELLAQSIGKRSSTRI